MVSSVRILRHDELPAAASIPAHAMFSDATPEAGARWAERASADHVHGSFRDDGALVGVARWFETELATTGEALPAAAVTSVGVLPSDRRRGHLTRLMEAQLAHVVDEGRPLAVLIAAEHPIYGRFGYGPAAWCSDLTIDRRSARFRDAPTGSVRLVEADELRPALETAYRGRWARTPGAITRRPWFFDLVARTAPGQPNGGTGQPRGAVWRDGSGEVLGAVAYRVEELWDHYRPAGTVTVELLVGATPEAERELWRHLLELDWARTVTAVWRSVDDPLPLWLEDARVVAQDSTSDVFWVRILDVARSLGALRSPSPRQCTIDVVDPLGYAAGCWSVELGPDGAAIERTDRAPDVRLPVGALGSAMLGGATVHRLHEAGRVEEVAVGGVVRATDTFATLTRPWAPADF